MTDFGKILGEDEAVELGQVIAGGDPTPKPTAKTIVFQDQRTFDFEAFKKAYGDPNLLMKVRDDGICSVGYMVNGKPITIFNLGPGDKPGQYDMISLNLTCSEKIQKKALSAYTKASESVHQKELKEITYEKLSPKEKEIYDAFKKDAAYIENKVDELRKINPEKAIFVAAGQAHESKVNLLQTNFINLILAEKGILNHAFELSNNPEIEKIFNSELAQTATQEYLIKSGENPNAPFDIRPYLVNRINLEKFDTIQKEKTQNILTIDMPGAVLEEALQNADNITPRDQYMAKNIFQKSPKNDVFLDCGYIHMMGVANDLSIKDNYNILQIYLHDDKQVKDCDINCNKEQWYQDRRNHAMGKLTDEQYAGTAGKPYQTTTLSEKAETYISTLTPEQLFTLSEKLMVLYMKENGRALDSYLDKPLKAVEKKEEIKPTQEPQEERKTQVKKGPHR